jgi:hypothetical protein
MRTSDRFAGAAAGLTAGLVVGVLVVLLAAVRGAAIASSTQEIPQAVLDATHLPPLLRPSGEPVDLRYDVHCAPPGELVQDAPCDASGSVFVAPAGTSASAGVNAWRELPLRIESGAVDGRYVASVPADLVRARSGFAYYAVFRSASANRTFTLPAGGASAPQLSYPLVQPVEVVLGRHAFGRLHRADARVAEARWGDAPGEVGLEQSLNLPPIGGSSFDVSRDGTVHLLDQVHRRVLRWAPGSAAPRSVILPISGQLADLAVADDGSLHVLELAAAAQKPVLHTFDAAGREQATVEIADRTASQIRVAENRPLVLEQPSGQWMAAEAEGVPLESAAQRRSGRPGRVVPGGGELVVLRAGDEIRAALVGERGLRTSWVVRSETPIAEVQLAEPVPGGLVVVARLYTDTADEFAVLVLDSRGLVHRFAARSAAWAETAPLGRFRLEGSSLYELGSTESGVFVDRFDLAVR